MIMYHHSATEPDHGRIWNMHTSNQKRIVESRDSKSILNYAKDIKLCQL
jgi:hypothetical protein